MTIVDELFCHCLPYCCGAIDSFIPTGRTSGYSRACSGTRASASESSSSCLDKQFLRFIVHIRHHLFLPRVVLDCYIVKCSGSW